MALPQQENSRKRALKEEEATSSNPPHKAGGAGQGRGRGEARGRNLWGWVGIGYYEEKPAFTSCRAHKRAECSECYRWEGRK